jgi:hypothetical protein
VTNPRQPDSLGKPGGSLDGAVLLALQLRARGYADAQIAPLVEQTPGGVSALLTIAVERLGAPDLPRAIREARRRGLIV